MSHTDYTYNEWLELPETERHRVFDQLSPYEDHVIFTGLEKDFKEWAAKVAPSAEATLCCNHGSMELRITIPREAEGRIFPPDCFRGMIIRIVMQSEVEEHQRIEEAMRKAKRSWLLIPLFPFIALCGAIGWGVDALKGNDRRRSLRINNGRDKL